MNQPGLKRKTRLKPRRQKARPGRLRCQALREMRLDCYARDRGKCTKCHCYTIFDAPSLWDHSYHMDHIVPRHMGGKDELSNVRVMCGRCHRARHDGEKPCPKKVGAV